MKRQWTLAAMTAAVAYAVAVPAEACFMRSALPVQVWLDKVNVDIVDQVAVKTYDCRFRNPNGRAIVGGTCYMELEPGAQVDNLSVIVNGKTVQAEILDLLRHLQAEYDMALLLITHDIGAVAEMADRVMVMYAGKIFESGDVGALFNDARHPYTQGLLASAPKLGVGRGEPLRGIPGTVPDFLELPEGCTFHPRCGWADTECVSSFPPTRHIGGGRQCACYKAS